MCELSFFRYFSRGQTGRVWTHKLIRWFQFLVDAKHIMCKMAEPVSQEFCFSFVHWEEASSSSIFIVCQSLYLCVSNNLCLWVHVSPSALSFVCPIIVMSSFSPSCLSFACLDSGMFQIQDLCPRIFELITWMDRFLGFHHCLHF